MYQQDKGAAEEGGDRRDVADKIEVEIVVKCSVDRVRRTHQQECMPVCSSVHDRLCRDIAACPWPVLDNELLSEALRQPLTDQTRDYVIRTTGGKSDDDSYRP